jgi:hypothetical protein
MKKSIGNMSDGKRIEGVVSTFFIVRQATPEATGQTLTDAPTGV